MGHEASLGSQAIHLLATIKSKLDGGDGEGTSMDIVLVVMGLIVVAFLWSHAHEACLETGDEECGVRATTTPMVAHTSSVRSLVSNRSTRGGSRVSRSRSERAPHVDFRFDSSPDMVPGSRSPTNRRIV